MRNVLDTATLTAIRWKPVLRDHYRRLVAPGRPKKVALMARLRRLFGSLDATLRRRTRWQTA